MRFRVAPQYSALQKFGHWLLVGLCITQFPTAYAIHRTHEASHQGNVPAAFDMFLHQVHAWSGWTVLLLATTLLAARIVHGAPSLPDGMTVWQRRIAHAAHAGLYGLILALAATGTGAMYIWRGFAPVHVALLNTAIALVTLHVAAVIWHQMIRRDGLFLRMLPQRPTPSGIAKHPAQLHGLPGR